MSNDCTDVSFIWTPEQAAAIIDYLDRLRDLVWEYYGEEIVLLRQDDTGTAEYQEVIDFVDEESIFEKS